MAALVAMDAQRGRYLVSDGRRKPRNTTSSQKGAHTATVAAYMRGSNRVLHVDGILDAHGGCRELQGDWEERGVELRKELDDGKEPAGEDCVQIPPPRGLNRNHSADSGRNLERHEWSTNIPTAISATSVDRLYRACARRLMAAWFNPASWDSTGMSHEPMNQKAMNHRNMTCRKNRKERHSSADCTHRTLLLNQYTLSTVLHMPIQSVILVHRVWLKHLVPATTRVLYDGGKARGDAAYLEYGVPFPWHGP